MAKIKYRVKSDSIGKVIFRKGKILLKEELPQYKLKMLYNLGHTDTIEKYEPKPAEKQDK